MNHDTIEGIQLVLPLLTGISILTCSLIGYIGSKLYEKLNEMSGTLRSIERDLRSEIGGIDRRVTRLESIGHVKDALQLFQNQDNQL